MATINWGIIGCGNVTEVKSGPPLYKVPNSRLVAVMRRNAAKAEDYARRHNVAKWYSDAEMLLDDPEINSVYIATPPSSHLQYALAALERGLNVYVDKPVTLNAAEARAMYDGLQTSKSKLSVAHYRRALPMFLHVKELLAAKAIGGVRTVQIKTFQSAKAALITKTADNWRINPEQSGGGYFHDLSPHQLDLMLFYFGEPLYFSGHSLNQAGLYTVSDHTFGTIVFKNNLVVNGSWLFNVSEDEIADQCLIVGSEGSISFPFFNGPHEVTLKNANGVQTRNFTHPQHISYPMIERVVNYFNGDTENPCGIDDAVVLMDIIDAFGKGI